jgi:hypothetical protein
MFTVVMAASFIASSILAVAARAVSPDASDMTVVAGVAFCRLMLRVLRLLSAKQTRALQACFSTCLNL